MGNRAEERPGVRSSSNGRTHSFSIVLTDAQCAGGHSWECELPPGQRIPEWCPECDPGREEEGPRTKILTCIECGEEWEWIYREFAVERPKFCPTCRPTNRKSPELQVLTCQWDGHVWKRKFRKGNPPKFCPEHYTRGWRREYQNSRNGHKKKKVRLSHEEALLEIRKNYRYYVFNSLTVIPPSPAHPMTGPMTANDKFLMLTDIENECPHNHLPLDKNITCDCWGTNGNR